MSRVSMRSAPLVVAAAFLLCAAVAAQNPPADAPGARPTESGALWAGRPACCAASGETVNASTTAAEAAARPKNCR